MPMEPGAVVEWVSQSLGVPIKKRGTIVAFIPAGADASTLLPDGVPPSRLKGGHVSQKDRYLVAVTMRHTMVYGTKAEGFPLKPYGAWETLNNPHYYTPTVSMLGAGT